MFYRFDQNNSYGKFLKPAREVIVEADTEAEALQVAETIEGIYFKGSSDRDCPCCGPRWTRWCLEYTDDEMKEYLDADKSFMSWLSPSVPRLLIRYRDGSTKTIENTNDNKALDVPVDMPMPEPVPMETQEFPAPVEGES